LTTVMQLILSSEKMNTWIQINVGWGLAISFTVYLCAKTSGGHYNPAVSLAMVSFGKLPFTHFLVYIVVQTAGAFVGAAASYGLYYGKCIKSSTTLGSLSGDQIHETQKQQNSAIYKGTKRESRAREEVERKFRPNFAQVAGTGLLVFFVAVIIDKRNGIPEAAHPWLFGFVLMMIGNLAAIPPLNLQVVDESGSWFMNKYGLILSGPGAERSLTDKMASDFGKEKRRNDASILRKMAWGQVDVAIAIEETGVEVVDDLLHGSSGRGDGSVRTSESGHLFLEVGEAPAGSADVQPCLCSFSQHLRRSLFKILLYRRSA
uniref:Aquaporin n=1 Tax=Heligmosomoides polygyrus TaxID=6339 RepID=A0A8L8K4I7_HELPZ